MSDYLYSLDTSRPTKQYDCPSCGKKQLKLYLNNETKEILSETVGRCNREHSCGYHYTPKQYFQDNPHLVVQPPKYVPPKKDKPQPPISFVPFSVLKRSKQKYHNNNLVAYLFRVFPPEMVKDALRKYHVGTSKHWRGATVFWQVDKENKVRSGKIMVYDRATGKRIRKPYKRFQWAHTLLPFADFNLGQCLFGENLLPMFPNKPIAVVESEKTALIASILIPDCIWVATGGITQLTPSKFKALKEREIIFYPDLGAWEKWNKKAEALRENGYRVVVSDILEKIATEEERESGLDIADYFVKLNNIKKNEK